MLDDNQKTLLAELQELVVDNPDLEKLESLLDQFNIFEAIGAVRQEVRHSDFLAFLLNPRQNHGLGDIFIKRLLQKTISKAGAHVPLTPIDLDIWDLNEIDVRREWQSIDIFILDEEHQFAVIIENKVYSGEHSNQLHRYYQAVCEHYPEYKVLALFLTPDGEPPKDDDNYIPISYSLICTLVETLIATRATTLGQGVLTLMNHYAQMLRRYIVGESEIEQLCRQIYKKHKKALDLIYEYRPDQQNELSELLKELIVADGRFELDQATKASITFIPKAWDFPLLRQGSGWTKSGRMLLFQLINSPELVRLLLYIGPGPDEIRQRLWTMVTEHEPPFKRAYQSIGKMWASFYSRTFLPSAAYKNKTMEEMQEEVLKHWQEFVDHDLPRFHSVVMNEKWLKEFKIDQREL